MAFLEFKTVSKGYPGVQALSNVSFGVEKAPFTGLWARMALASRR